MTFLYARTIRFQETDGAGVVYFANGLALCHEAYEASLATAGVDLGTFFARGPVAYPIVHASIDFRAPLACGDRISIALTPRQADSTSFEIFYRIYLADQPERSAATAQTRHVCIDTAKRSRRALAQSLLDWIEQFGEASSPES
ncbi:MAG: acyl-CoA thioesterase, partial [Cyanobacteria bacterium Co-bin8]|nr:acyl-CoA thioesterase [Cyanobacteria bacterium Co-bin8]